MRRERAMYLDDAGTLGGSASGFRIWVATRSAEDPKLFPYEGLRDEAATKAWEEQPRQKGPDLFSINGKTVPEYLTRPAKGFVDGEDLGDSDQFEKVAAKFATVADGIDDATIKLRQAARASAAAELDMQAAEAWRRKARGDVARFLRDLKD